MRGNNIYWDLDGVLRDLCVQVFGKHADSWDQLSEDGRSLMDVIDDDLTLLFTAPELEYANIAREFAPLHILTVQPDHWRKQTGDWVDKHFYGAKLKFLNKAEDKLKFLESGTRVLIEDYPKFTSYNNIILVDRPYNRCVKNVQRVTSPLGLMNALRRRYDNLE